jgi:hypothetical protein
MPEALAMDDHFQLNSPVAFVVFNRPDTTARVFAEIRRAKPPILFIIADGARSTVSGESKAAEEVRRIATAVDWPCKVLTDFAESNLGCKRRVSSGLTWVFDKVDRAIILEDDVLPDPTFFRFCEELLLKYENDERILSITGSSFLSGYRRTSDSYYFSRCGSFAGWATWRRAWKLYDGEMKIWPTFRDGGWLKDVFHNRFIVERWTTCLERTYRNDINSWGYRWELTLWANNGLAIVPHANLVSNLGYGAGATHTTRVSEWAAVPTQPMTFPLTHPSFIVPDTQADALLHKRGFYWRPALLRRIRRKLLGLRC